MTLVALGVAAAEPSRRIRAGFLGASHSHAQAKLKVCAAHAAFEVAGVCEPSDRIKQELALLNIPFLDQEKLVEASDVVFVESGVGEHFQQARAVLKGGRHVHVEKPPAVTLAELRELVALSRAGGLVLQTGYMWRHNPGFEWLFKAVHERWIGDVFMIRAHMANQISASDRPAWAKFGGGSFFEQASHLVDPLARLMGKPKSVHSTLRTHGSKTDSLKDNNIVTFEFENALAVITNSSLQPNGSAHRSFEVFGSGGSIRLSPVEPPVLELELSKAAGGFPAGKSSVPLPKYERHVADMGALAFAIREGRPLTVSLEEELLVHETLLRACQMEG